MEPSLGTPLGLTLAGIIRDVIALIARVLCRHPLLALRVIPYCNRLNRAAQRFTALMARIAAGTPTRTRAPRRTPRPSQPKPDRLPARKAWLLHTMRDHPERHNAAAFGNQLAHLLAQPGVPEFLAAHPAANRILNPIRHFLGLPTTRKPRQPRASTVRPPRPPRPKPRRTRSWTAILAEDQALHPRPILKKPA